MLCSVGTNHENTNKLMAHDGCVCERERERERVCVCVRVYVCVCPHPNSIPYAIHLEREQRLKDEKGLKL